MATPIWPLEGVALDSTGEMVANSLADHVINAETDVGTLQADVTDIKAVTDALPDAGVLTSISDETDKIDGAVTDGLAGTNNSLAYRVHEIEKHFHSRERWWGAVAVPDETNAIDANVTRPYQATSGNDDWGAAIPIIGTGDVPVPAGLVKFDLHRLLITSLDDETDPWRIRIIYGTTNSAAAIAAGDWSEMMVEANAVPGNRAGRTPLELQMPRQDVGTKCWAQSWNDTVGEVMEFFIACHGYAG